MEKQIESNWFDAPEYEPSSEEGKVRLPKFNITLAKGEIARTEEIIFISNGKKINNQYGESILFQIQHKNVDMVWFIKAKSYSLLKEIKAAIPVEGKAAYVTRAGTTQADTRWAIKIKQ
jgi:hypothetical protein